MSVEKRSTRLKFKQPAAAKKWEKRCEVVIVEQAENGLFYGWLRAPFDGCGQERETARRKTANAALTLALKYANDRKMKIISLQEGIER